jgi:hypothetical protein
MRVDEKEHARREKNFPPLAPGEPDVGHYTNMKREEITQPPQWRLTLKAKFFSSYQNPVNEKQSQRDFQSGRKRIMDMDDEFNLRRPIK